MDSKKIKKHDNGFLTIPAILTRTGILKYINHDGTVIKELRPASEVFKQKSMDSLGSIPITNDHPTEKSIDITNAKKHQSGLTGNEVKIVDEKFLMNDMIITDGDLIKDIENGKHEISCGYTAMLDFIPGVFNGEKYDAIQKDICYNHVALVNKGRAGSKVRLHLDNDCAIMVLDEDDLNKLKGEIKMKKIKIGDKEFEVNDDVAEAFNAQAKKDEEAKTEETKKAEEKVEETKKETEKKDADIKSLNEKLDALPDTEKTKAKIDQLEDDKKKLQEKVDAMPKEINDKAKTRLALIDVAKKTLNEETLKKLDEMDEKQIKQAVIKEKAKVDDIETKSDSYIDARFDMIVEKLGNKDHVDGEELGEKILNAEGNEIKIDDIKNASQVRRSKAWDTTEKK